MCCVNVTLTQLHPNSWGYLQCFHLLCEMFDFYPSLQSFLHYYSVSLGTPICWMSLVCQFGCVLFSPYIISYKWFKTGFFRVTIESSGCKYFYYGDVPKFPFYWTSDPVYYLHWPRSSMSNEDQVIFNLFYSLPRRLPTRKLLSSIFAINIRLI